MTDYCDPAERAARCSAELRSKVRCNRCGLDLNNGENEHCTGRGKDTCSIYEPIEDCRVAAKESSSANDEISGESSFCFKTHFLGDSENEEPACYKAQCREDKKGYDIFIHADGEEHKAGHCGPNSMRGNSDLIFTVDNSLQNEQPRNDSFKCQPLDLICGTLSDYLN